MVRAPFMSTAYSACYHRDAPEPDLELTQLGPGSPSTSPLPPSFGQTGDRPYEERQRVPDDK